MFKVLDSAVPIACWSCSIGHNDSTLFCPHCSKIQPPPGGDYFSVFGLEPKLNLDLPALEHEFHRLSRKLHPDRFARALDNEKQWSLADTALLNDAYRTLKDPLRRTEYLLKLLGAELRAEDDRQKGKSAGAPADLLEEVFELNMQLEEMRAARADFTGFSTVNECRSSLTVSGIQGWPKESSPVPCLHTTALFHPASSKFFCCQPGPNSSEVFQLVPLAKTSVLPSAYSTNSVAIRGREAAFSPG